MSNVKTDVFRLYAMDVEPDECWVWQGTWGGRSRTLRPYFTYGGQRSIAYRVVYELVHGVTLTSEQQVRHSCDQGGHPIGCGNPRHMEVGTNKENVDDRQERHRWGLSAHTVRGIRTLHEKGRSNREIAEVYGISDSAVSRIVHRMRRDTEDT